MIQFDEDKQKRKIGGLLKKEEEDLVQILASKYGIEYINLVDAPVSTDALALIPEIEARESKAAGFLLVDKKIKIAVREPDNQKTIDTIDKLKVKGYSPIIYICSMASLEKAWKGYKDLSFAYESKAGSLEVSNEEISNLLNTFKSLVDVKAKLNEILSMNKIYRISRILETAMAGAMAIDASDIHLEPEEDYVRLRYRLDGVLADVINFDLETYKLLLSRIKLLSGMKLNIQKDSQDGRFSVHVKDSDIEIRASILPGAYDESVVLRILNPKSISVPLESLGIPQKLFDVLMHEISKPKGMILTTGPTGSGKTTTLYAFLKKIHTPDIKIITIEDPIEYHLPGIVQTQINDKGYGFIDGLRAALRQDPDIIMVGEIRDGETAKIAINSALTGHLVFSTLHTNTAAGTFPRLSDLGVNPKIISSAINIAMAQRLVRKLCPSCKKEVAIEGQTKEKIDKILEKIVDKSQIPENREKMWVAVGCDKCNNTGYKSRVGIYEAIIINQDIENIVSSNPSERDIENVAKNQGIMTLEEDAVVKVLGGVTSFDELERVVGIEEE